MSDIPITRRTFGLELEYADVEKEAVTLPDGFTWSKEETFINTDMSLVSHTSKRGGEVNTPPLSLSHHDIERLRFAFSQLLACGGHVTWVTSIHVHIGIADLGLEELKRLFALSYYTGRFIKRYSDLEDWNDEMWYTPLANLSYYEAAMKADTMEQFLNVFVCSLRKGYIRHIVNVASFFKRGTVEFRNFNATTDFNELLACILFAYRFVDYALTHDDDDFRSITTYENFIKELHIHAPAPSHTPPLIFVGNMKDYKEVTRGCNVSLNSKMLHTLVSCIHGDDIATVNPDMYVAELNLYKRFRLTVYNNDEFHHIIYLICREGLRIHYTDKFSFIERLNGDTAEQQLVCLLLFHRLRRYVVDNEYAMRELSACIDKIDETAAKIAVTAREYISLFAGCTYVHGTLNTALSEHDTVFYQISNDPRVRATAKSLHANSDYCGEFDSLTTQYYRLIDDLPPSKTLMMLSRNLYLPMRKAAIIGDVTSEGSATIFYTTAPGSDSGKVTTSVRATASFAIDAPPDSLDISDAKELRVVKVSARDFFHLQKTYIRKVHKVTPPRFAYLVYYGKYCLGGFGFSYPKDEDYDLWLLSDFNTNNNVFRLSKLVLLCIQSDVVKKSMSRVLRSNVRTMYTKVYTKNPVSMKYRGVFKKHKEKSNQSCLIYTSEFGTSGSYSDIIDKYNKMKR